MDSGNQSSLYIWHIAHFPLAGFWLRICLPSVMVSPVFDGKGAGGIVDCLIEHSSLLCGLSIYYPGEVADPHGKV